MAGLKATLRCFFGRAIKTLYEYILGNRLSIYIDIVKFLVFKRSYGTFLYLRLAFT